MRGLRLGADDWVSKPCPRRRSWPAWRPSSAAVSLHDPRADRAPVEVGGLAVRPDRFQAFAGDVSADLTRREFELIQLLAERRGPGDPARGDLRARVGLRDGPRRPLVDVFVRKLRQKLEKVSPDWRYIHTHFGIGYRFAAEPPGDAAAPAEGPGRRDVLLSA